MKHRLVMIAVALWFAGCASVGTPIATQNISQIQKGVTTEADLIRMFGPPTDKSFDANDRVVMTWIHSAAQARGTSFIPFAGPFVGGTNVQVQKLIVIMGKDGRVVNYTMNESHPNMNMGGE